MGTWHMATSGAEVLLKYSGFVNMCWPQVLIQTAKHRRPCRLDIPNLVNIQRIIVTLAATERWNCRRLPPGQRIRLRCLAMTGRQKFL